jgi:drug/metabolite transporter (DMT)-like permease
VALAVLLFGEVLRPLPAVGIAVVLAGVPLLSLDRRWQGERWSIWVMALPLAAAAIRGLTQPLTKAGLALWPNPFAAALIGYTVSSIVIAGAALLGEPRRATAGGRSGALWFAGVGLCNGSAVLALYAALQRGPVTLVSPLVATYPFFTLALTAILPGTARLAPARIIGLAMTVAGVALLLSG